MANEQDLSDSYKSLASILATIGGSLFVAAGISATFFSSSLRTALTLTNQGYDLAIRNATLMNSTNTTRLIEKGSMKALEASTQSLQFTFILFGQGVLISCFSVLFWYNSHLILKGMRHNLSLRKYALGFFIGEILLILIAKTI